MKTVAVIDCAISEPTLACYNRLIQQGVPASYHSANLFGLKTLDNLENFYAAIILGSYTHVHENLQWHNELKDWSINALKKNLPILGICFGHQLIASAFGSTISKNPNGNREGLVEINAEQESYSIFYSHEYHVSALSSDFMEVGSSSELPNEIIQHKTLPFRGVQGHPEGSERFNSQMLDVPLDSKNSLTCQRDGIRLIKNFLNDYAKDSLI